MTDESDQVTPLKRQIDLLTAQVRELQEAGGAHALGHFYSPIPGRDDIAVRLTQLESAKPPRDLPEINLRADEQLKTLERLGTAIAHAPPFPERQTDGFRYYFENTQYSYNDAILLHGMLRLLRPKRIIEIGSGFSSAVMLDTNDLFLGGQLTCTFIEPHTERLMALLRPSDHDRCRVFQSKVQDVDISIFSSLSAGDFLFVDSSHVVKFGSDLEYILREVLPALPLGVFIHFHDVNYPFEYDPAVIRLGHYWNECYMIRAFLSNNSRYRVELFGDYIATFHRAALETVSPLCLKNTGASLWISKSTP